MCVKNNNVEAYSKQRVSLVRMQDENTNSGGKQENESRGEMKKRRWLFDDWKKVIVLYESQIMIGNDNRVYICRKGDETFQPDYLCKQKNQCHDLGLHFIQ